MDHDNGRMDNAVHGNRLLNDIRNILLIQLGDIGDVVLSLPAILALRSHFIKSRLVVCVREKAKGLLEDTREVDDILSVNKKKRPLLEEIGYQVQFFSKLRKYRFDLSIDLRTGTRGTVIALLSGSPYRVGRLDDGPQTWRKAFFTQLVKPDPSMELNQYASEHHLNILASIGITAKDRIPDLKVTEEKRRRILCVLAKAGVSVDKPMVALHPFSLWPYKEWRQERWVRLIDYLTGPRSLSVLVTGSAEERGRASEMLRPFRRNVFNLAGKTDIGELPALIEACCLFIGVDSGVLHIAGAVGVPTVAIFGPSSPVTWAPRRKRHVSVSKEMPCIPCRRKGCQGNGISRCLDELSYEEVKKAIDAQMEPLSP